MMMVMLVMLCEVLEASTPSDKGALREKVPGHLGPAAAEADTRHITYIHGSSQPP